MASQQLSVSLQSSLDHGGGRDSNLDHGGGGRDSSLDHGGGGRLEVERVPDVSDERKQQLTKATGRKFPWSKGEEDYYEAVSSVWRTSLSEKTWASFCIGFTRS